MARSTCSTYDKARETWPDIPLIRSRNGSWRPERPTCHPDKPYHCGGLCRGCYERQYRTTYLRPDLSTCGHPEAPYGGRGMCHDCLTKDGRRRKSAAADPCANHPDRKAWEARKGQRLCQECLDAFVPECIHKDRRARSNGLCDNCNATIFRKSVRNFGLPMDVWREYLGPTPACDVCGSTDARNPKGFNIDHQHGHKCQVGSSRFAFRRMCVECVRANLCFRCNIVEGVLREAISTGTVAEVTGPIAALFGPIEDTPFQRWRRSREEAAA